jgi:hypothetical protein
LGSTSLPQATGWHRPKREGVNARQHPESTPHPEPSTKAPAETTSRRTAGPGSRRRSTVHRSGKPADTTVKNVDDGAGYLSAVNPVDLTSGHTSVSKAWRDPRLYPDPPAGETASIPQYHRHTGGDVAAHARAVHDGVRDGPRNRMGTGISPVMSGCQPRSIARRTIRSAIWRWSRSACRFNARYSADSNCAANSRNSRSENWGEPTRLTAPARRHHAAR